MELFISHIHEEAAVAHVLKDWIETTFSGNIEVFVSSDIDDIPAGSRWLDMIDSALASSSLFAMLCSPTSINRVWVNFEAGCAWIKRVPLIPVCHSGLTKVQLPTPISTFQGIEIDSPTFVQDFFESLKIHFKMAKLPRIDKSAMVRDIARAIDSISKLNPPKTQLPVTSLTAVSDEDALNSIESWMGSRPASDNTNVIRFADVDAELNLPRGTAEKLIEVAASRWGYITRRKGADTILFMERPNPPRDDFRW